MPGFCEEFEENLTKLAKVEGEMLQNSGYTALGSDGQGPKGFSFAFLEFSGFLFAFSDLLTDVGEHVWASWSVRRGVYRGLASSCEYVRCAPSHRGPVRP